MPEPSRRPVVHAKWGPPPAARRPGRLRRCRVEHRDGGAATVLARGVELLPYAHELAPFASRLRLDGAAGEVRSLVDEAGGAELARLAVRSKAAGAAGVPAARGGAAD